MVEQPEIILSSQRLYGVERDEGGVAQLLTLLLYKFLYHVMLSRVSLCT